MGDIYVIPAPLCANCGDYTAHFLLTDGYECSVCGSFQSKPNGRRCPDCDGYGFFHVQNGDGRTTGTADCDTCDGTGRLATTEATA